MFADHDKASDASFIGKAPPRSALARRPDAKKRVITIGSNEGARKIDSPQPTIAWRKPRVSTPKVTPTQPGLPS
jgi:hypothetical protein